MINLNFYCLLLAIPYVIRTQVSNIIPLTMMYVGGVNCTSAKTMLVIRKITRNIADTTLRFMFVRGYSVETPISPDIVKNKPIQLPIAIIIALSSTLHSKQNE